MRTTTILEILLNFRSAIIAIVPSMDTIRVTWRDEEAYDEWDDITSTLFRNMVEKTIRHAVEFNFENTLAPYDLLIPSYDHCSFISVKHKGSVGETLAFVGFSTRVHPFDLVKCVTVNNNQTSERENIYFPVDECEFFFLLRDNTGRLNPIIGMTLEE